MGLIEKLRAVKWEEADDGDRTPDDPTHKCVFVDMRPDDFRALLREAAAALEAAREDAERYRWLRDHGFQHADVYLGTDFDGDNFVSYRIDFHLPEPAHMKFEDDEWVSADIDAAIDQARGKGEP